MPDDKIGRLADVLDKIGADPRLPPVAPASQLPPKRARIRSFIFAGHRHWVVDFHDANGRHIDTSPFLPTWVTALRVAREWTR